MGPIYPLIIILPLIGFWGWMLWDLAGNDRIPTNAKYYWALAFLVANIFAAVYYYIIEYRNRY